MNWDDILEIIYFGVPCCKLEGMPTLPVGAMLAPLVYLENPQLSGYWRSGGIKGEVATLTPIWIGLECRIRGWACSKTEQLDPPEGASIDEHGCLIVRPPESLQEACASLEKFCRDQCKGFWSMTSLQKELSKLWTRTDFGIMAHDEPPAGREAYRRQVFENIAVKQQR
jgi:hypothetical protein